LNKRKLHRGKIGLRKSHHHAGQKFRDRTPRQFS
jgi:hypothetical protein